MVRNWHLSGRAMPRWLARALNPFSKLVFPNVFWCGRCGLTWAVCPAHVTETSEWSGVFALCHHCWTELGTPDARLPFYQELVFAVWEPESRSKWPDVEASVLAGG